MYKIGDKVETPLGIGKLVDISQNNETKFKVAYGTKTTWYAHDEITPYRTAHEKLIEMGWKLKSKLPNEIIYGIFEVRLTFRKYEDGLWRFTLSENLGVYKNFSYVLTQYLEELEEK